ncbi:MarR family winged helix-turn-helix transcriptional regulator [Desulfolucanica intricata]|uniref:MarR family winged helix-turn-helix transcriptional regulator n=1 Tax=Desulfolucanica intricata TaxID=1285191 RepID=UPI000836CDE6|nr:MarR family transcriptional regulator [Desulfolucanica intricata]
MIENRELLELFSNVLRKMKKEWSNQLEHGLSPSQYFILKTLKETGPRKATELAEVIQMTPGAITGASDKLVSEGYAERKGTKEDRRVVYLEITEKGKEFVENMNEKQKSVTAKFFEGLSDEDINHLIRIYKQISHNLDGKA